MKLSEKLQDLHDCGDVGLCVEGFADEARILENLCDSLSADNSDLDCILDKYLKLLCILEKMLTHGDWYAGAVEGNPHIDFEEFRRQIIEII